MFIEIPDEVVENWSSQLEDMRDMYNDSTRSDWFDADDIARSVAEELMSYLPVNS